MTRLRSRFLAASATLAVCLVSTIALGGAVASGTVYVQTYSGGGGYFEGGFWGARNSSDSSQTIGCEIVPGSSPFAYCFGETSSGVYASCTTTNAQQVAALAGLNESSFLSVDFNSAGTCTSFTLDSISYFVP